ncbi:hypothetical protein [Actinomycetospora straminea]|uniref:Secreted protein n=1 Tax=Actinomycetospora straminea TaxID=663607 RepID=A0ABP9EEW5_9PSEU|nr:hypothetical protein [Actinomycetospora straminea]MDD7935667.1 hypothetical protein [Actinomycetospora straminea]
MTPSAPATRRLAAVGAVLASVLVLAGCGGSSGPQSYPDLSAVIQGGGLVVCSSRPVPNPPGTQAQETQALTVGSTDAGELSAEGQNGSGDLTCAPSAVTVATASRYDDQDARDQAAQSLQGTVPPASGTTVHSTGAFVVVVADPNNDGPTDRLDEVLTKAAS